MNSSSVINSDSIIADNLIHNRLRFKADFNNKLSAIVEMRNRVFFGQGTNLNPQLGKILDNDIGNLDLSLIAHDSRTLVVHSIFDRAYLKYSSENSNYSKYLTDLVDKMIELTTDVKNGWNEEYRDSFINSTDNTSTSSINKLTNDFIYYFEKG